MGSTTSMPTFRRHSRLTLTWTPVGAGSRLARSQTGWRSTSTSSTRWYSGTRTSAVLGALPSQSPGLRGTGSSSRRRATTEGGSVSAGMRSRPSAGSTRRLNSAAKTSTSAVASRASDRCPCRTAAACIPRRGGITHSARGPSSDSTSATSARRFSGTSPATRPTSTCARSRRPRRGLTAHGRGETRR